MEPIMRMPVQAVTLEVLRDAVSIADASGCRTGMGQSWPQRAPFGCDAVYSEDLSSEQDYDGLRVINPFPEAPIAQ